MGEKSEVTEKMLEARWGGKSYCKYYDRDFEECGRGYAYSSCDDCPEYVPCSEVEKP